MKAIWVDISFCGMLFGGCYLVWGATAAGGAMLVLAALMVASEWSKP